MDKGYTNDSLKKNFFNEIKEYLEKVTKENFSTMYDEFSDIIVKYNNEMSKIEIFEVLDKYIYSYQDSMNIYQDEVLVEVYNRLIGFCSPFHCIILK